MGKYHHRHENEKWMSQTNSKKKNKKEKQKRKTRKTGRITGIFFHSEKSTRLCYPKWFWMSLCVCIVAKTTKNHQKPLLFRWAQHNKREKKIHVYNSNFITALMFHHFMFKMFGWNYHYHCQCRCQCRCQCYWFFRVFSIHHEWMGFCKVLGC